jgi:hypothetical protein
MASHFGADCLPNPLQRDADGKVACDVIWQLPTAAVPGSPTPTACDSLAFLTRASGGRSQLNEAGGQNCMVQQVAVANGHAKDASGWIYDDFSDDAKRQCEATSARRIAFTPDAQPPFGVRVTLDCAPQRIE